MTQKLKRILALFCVIVIVLFIIAAFVVAIIDFPNKLVVFTGMAAGVVFLPIFAWIFIWMFGILTRKKTIASFRSEEMEKTMEQAEQIKYALNHKENSNESKATTTEAPDGADEPTEE